MVLVASGFRMDSRLQEKIEGSATVVSLLIDAVSQTTEPVIESSSARRNLFFANEGRLAAVQAPPHQLRDQKFGARLRTGSYCFSSRRHHRSTRVKGSSNAGIVPLLLGNVCCAGVFQS